MRKIIFKGQYFECDEFCLGGTKCSCKYCTEIRKSIKVEDDSILQSPEIQFYHAFLYYAKGPLLKIPPRYVTQNGDIIWKKGWVIKINWDK